MIVEVWSDLHGYGVRLTGLWLMMRGFLCLVAFLFRSIWKLVMVMPRISLVFGSLLTRT